MSFEITSNVEVKRDADGIVRRLHHPRQAFGVESASRAALARASTAAAVSARALADEYLNEVLPILGLEAAAATHLTGRAAAGEEEEDTGLQFTEEKALGRQTIVGYAQTVRGLPVWNAGVSVKLRNRPYRVTGSQSSMHLDVAVDPPPEDAPYRAERLDEQVLAGLLGLINAEQLTINGFETYVIRFEPGRRVPGADEHDDTQMHLGTPTLRLPPLPEGIEEGRHYVAVRALFRLGSPDSEALNWSAFIEPRTGAVLRLDCFIGCVDGLVYERDPRTKGNTIVTPTSSAAALNALRDQVRLEGLNGANGGQQTLRGDWVTVQDVSPPNVQPPTRPQDEDFNFGVPSNNFAAVNAYFHCDRLFRLVEEMGFDVTHYFDRTQFPVRVDHRVSYRPHPLLPPTPNIVNASAPGNAAGNGSDGFRFALLQSNTDVGMAVDWRVTLHEFGHAIMWDHVNSANFVFAHSAGDSLAAILNDPGTQAPDRFDTFPWTPIRRRHDRRVEDGWGWGGENDSNIPVGFPGPDAAGYRREQILSSTLFRLYRALGGDHTDPAVQTEAARYVVFLVLSAVGVMTQFGQPQNAEDFAEDLIDADESTDAFERWPGGIATKLIRWAFERQGAYQSTNAPTPTIHPGAPPGVDVFIDDGRGGEYAPRTSFVFSSAHIWNRLADDGALVNEAPVAGQENFLFVRVGNRGTQPARNVRVQMAFSRAQGERIWPDDWDALPSVSANAPGDIAPNDDVVVGPLPWVPPGTGQIAVLARTSADGDGSLDVDPNTPIHAARLAHCDNNTSGRIFQVVAAVEQERVSASTTPLVTIPDADPAGVVSGLSLATDGRVGHISVPVVILHSWIGDLRVTLVSPSGTTVTLFEGHGQPNDHIITTFSSDTLQALGDVIGENAGGSWQLRAVDRVGQDEGILVRWGLEIRVA